MQIFALFRDGMSMFLSLPLLRSLAPCLFPWHRASAIESIGWIGLYRRGKAMGTQENHSNFVHDYSALMANLTIFF